MLKYLLLTGLPFREAYALTLLKSITHKTHQIVPTIKKVALIRSVFEIQRLLFLAFARYYSGCTDLLGKRANVQTLQAIV